MKVTLNLLVLHCKDIELTRRFYERLGWRFTKERHGKGPEHYVSSDAGLVLELYPVQGEHVPDMVRLGFSTALLADVSGEILHRSDITVLKPPYATADRLIMLLEDPDGRKVEVSQVLHR
jgi:catechol 2,3-dioxygenase-like lactoylglutathione lyase family enzyme